MTFDPNFDLSKFQSPVRSFPDGRYHVRVMSKLTGDPIAEYTFATEEEAAGEARAIRDRDENGAAILFSPSGQFLGAFFIQSEDDINAIHA